MKKRIMCLLLALCMAATALPFAAVAAEEAEPIAEVETTAEEPTAEAEPAEEQEQPETAEPAPETEPAEEPDPTEEPEPTEAAEPTPETEPADEPEPTEAAEPTPEAEPTEEPEPTETAEPAPEAEPTEEPEQPETAEPAPETEPTEEPEPTETAEPAPETEPTDEPETAAQDATEAEEELVVELFSGSGDLGDNLTWSLNSAGTLTISGTGEMPNYPSSSSSASYYAWYNSRSTIVKIVISDGITSIGNYCFYGCTSLTSVSIPQSVTTIKDDAFSGCTSLKSITIPNSVESLGSSAFDGCSSLNSVKFSNKLTYIGSYAFSSCYSLKTITIPDSVTEIGYRAFYNCTSLANAVIGNGVVTIGYSSYYNYDGAFQGCTSLKTVTLGSSVETIGTNTFSDCRSLSSITIPDSVKSIGDNAFSGCVSMASATIGNGVETIGSSAFSGCTGLASITFPNSVTYIGTKAFSGCTGLKTITLPSKIEQINSLVFAGCTGLKSVSIPASVNNIASDAFSGCSSLTKISVAAKNKQFSSADGVLFDKDKTEILCIPAGRAGNYVIPDTVEGIGASVFANCANLTGVTIPSSVTAIGSSAFSGCTKLASVNIPNSVTSIGSEAFSGCESLTAMDIPGSVVSIGYEAFYNCDGLKNLTLGNGLVTIGDNAFENCDGLVSVNIPDSVTNIGKKAFYYCRSLESAAIGAGVASIGYRAFYESALKRVSIPESVTSIGSDAFSSCYWYSYYSDGSWKWDYRGSYNLKHVYYAGSESQWKVISGYSNVYSSATIHYNTGSLPVIPVPKLSAAKAEPNKITVTWKAAKGAAGYQVYRKSGGSEWSRLAFAEGTSYVDEKVTGGASYSYSVAAIVDDVSGTYNTTGVSATVPGAPVLGSAVVTYYGEIYVSWNSVNGAENYQVYRKAAGDKSWTKLAETSAYYYHSTESYTDSTAEVGVTYSYTVRTKIGGKLLPGYDKTGVSATIPVAPKLKTAKSGPSKVTLTWAASTGASKYYVYRKTADYDYWSRLGETTSTSYVDESGYNNNTYSYTVAAGTESGYWSSYGDKSLSAVWLTAKPAKPNLTAATASKSNVKITWDATETATKYQVYRKTGSGDWAKLGSATTKTTYTDKSAKKGTAYSYAIKAYNALGWSGYSKAMTATVPTAKPAAPTVKSVTPGENYKVTIKWGAVKQAAKYRVYRKIDTGDWQAIGDSTTTSFVDQNAWNGGKYSYRVKAYNALGWSGYSKTVSATLPYSQPSAPVLSSAKASAGKIVVKWDTVESATKYQLYRKAGSGKWKALGKPTTKASYTDTSVKAGTKYSYRLAAYNIRGWSGYSNTVSAKGK